jgi:RNase P/RNase MRP subunit POP5
MQEVEDAIQRSCGEFHDKGMKFVHDTWDQEAKEGIIRVHHVHAQQLCNALAAIGGIGNKKVEVKTIGISGILRKAKLKFMKNKSIRKENKRNYHHRL